MSENKKPGDAKEAEPGGLASLAAFLGALADPRARKLEQIGAGVSISLHQEFDMPDTDSLNAYTPVEIARRADGPAVTRAGMLRQPRT